MHQALVLISPSHPPALHKIGTVMCTFSSKEVETVRLGLLMAEHLPGTCETMGSILAP